MPEGPGEVEAPSLGPIGGPSSVDEGDTATYTAPTLSGGNYDDVDSRTWTVAGTGSINASTGVYTAPAAVTSNVTVTIRYRVVVSGDGNNGIDGDTDAATVTKRVTITDTTLPDPTPPALSQITGPSSVEEGTSATYTVTETGGGYSSVVSRTWTRSPAQGTINASTGSYDAPDDVSSNTSVVISYKVTVRGDGTTYAAVDRSRTVTKSITITTGEDPPPPPPLPIAPAISIGGPSSVDEGDTANYSATLSGGNYDNVDSRTWTISPSSGAGSINSSTGAYTAPGDVSADLNATVRHTVTVSGDGTNARNNETATRTGTKSITVRNVPDPAPPLSLTVTITGAEDIDEDQTLQLFRTLTGNYDDVDSTTWEVLGSGTGSISSSGLYTPPDVSTSLRVRIQCTVTVSGTGNNAAVGSLTRRTSVVVQVNPVTVPLPDPNVTISIQPSSASIKTNEDQQFSYSLSGDYDTIDSITWSSNAPGGLFTPSGAGTYTVTVSVRVEGNGTDHAPGSSATDSDSATVTVVPAPPTLPAANVEVTVTGGGNIKENEDAQFSRSLSGDYDQVDSTTWSASPGAISQNGLYTPPNVGSSGAKYNVTCRVTVSGTGTNARSGTTDTDSDQSPTYDIIDVPTTTSKPDCNISVTITGATSIKENETLSLGRSVSGDYDQITSTTWSVVSGGGSISSSGRYTPPNISSNRTVTVRCRVAARGTGTNAKSGTTDTDSDTASFTVITVGGGGTGSKPNAKVTVTISGGESIKDNEDAQFSYSLSGTYDNVDSVTYTCSPGSISSSGLYTPPNVGPSGAKYNATVRVTVSGDGNNARDGTTATDSDQSSTYDIVDAG